MRSSLISTDLRRKSSTPETAARRLTAGVTSAVIITVGTCTPRTTHGSSSCMTWNPSRYGILKSRRRTSGSNAWKSDRTCRGSVAITRFEYPSRIRISSRRRTTGSSLSTIMIVASFTVAPYTAHLLSSPDAV
jgi:hypothetical protein